MSYHLNFSQQAQNDITFYKKTGNKVVLKKLLLLLSEISEHPFTGTGKPEALKYNLTGLWSRRINLEHR
jgi:toxin YoeB